jgi:hypothetical protein
MFPSFQNHDITETSGKKSFLCLGFFALKPINRYMSEIMKKNNEKNKSKPNVIFKTPLYNY